MNRPLNWPSRRTDCSSVAILLGVIALVCFLAQFRKWGRTSHAGEEKEQADAHLIASSTDKLADYTKWLVRATWATVGLAALILWVLVRQLDQAVIENRAFIFFRNPQHAVESYGKDKIVTISGEWINSGRTVPKHLRIWGMCGRANHGRGGDNFLRTPLNFSEADKGNDGWHEALVGPGSSITEKLCESLGSEFRHSPNHDPSFDFGKAVYWDIYGSKHVTEFCYQSYFNSNYDPWSFDMIPCLPPNDGHNCADDDCNRG